MATILEVNVGRVDVGGRLTALSQYPGEDEYLVGPYACLEVTARPRVEVTDKGQVLVVQVRMNANLKSVTVEELEARRKVLHVARPQERHGQHARGADPQANPPPPPPPPPPPCPCFCHGRPP